MFVGASNYTDSTNGLMPLQAFVWSSAVRALSYTPNIRAICMLLASRGIVKPRYRFAGPSLCSTNTQCTHTRRHAQYDDISCRPPCTHTIPPIPLKHDPWCTAAAVACLLHCAAAAAAAEAIAAKAKALCGGLAKKRGHLLGQMLQSVVILQ